MPSLPFRIMGGGDKNRRSTFTYPGSRTSALSSSASSAANTVVSSSSPALILHASAAQHAAIGANQSSCSSSASSNAPLGSTINDNPSSSLNSGVLSSFSAPLRSGLAVGSPTDGTRSVTCASSTTQHPQPTDSHMGLSSRQDEQQVQHQSAFLNMQQENPHAAPPTPSQHLPQRHRTERFVALDTSICTTASAPARVGVTNGSSQNSSFNQTSILRGTNVSSNDSRSVVGISPSVTSIGSAHSNAYSAGALPIRVAQRPSPTRPIESAAPSHRTGGAVGGTQSLSRDNNSNGLRQTTTNVGSNSSSSSSTATTTTTVQKPGAFQVTRTTTGPAQVYRVTVPAGVRPGTEFTVHAGPRRVRVRCPAASRPGQSLQITLPPEPVTNYMQLKSAPLTAGKGSGGGGAVQMSADVSRVNEQAAQAGGSAQTYLVTIPPNIYPGMEFTVNVGGHRFMVVCPDSAGPNMRVRIVPPVQREEPEAAPKTQVFEVAVPHGVQPGQKFTLVASGQRVLVTCPPGVQPGQKIRFQLPVSQVVGNIQLAYESEKGGWKRTIRVSDLKFQWVRIDAEKNLSDNKKGETENSFASSPGSENPETPDTMVGVDVEGMGQFDFSRAAYVRKINFLEGNDARMRTGTVELVPAHEAVVDSRLVVQNRTLLSYADIAVQQTKPFADKQIWFEAICKQLTTPWDDGHVKICIRRSHLLHDSVDAIMGLGRDDMRKLWRIEFLGEPAIDAGGPAREWFELITEQIFDPACGLWIASVNNQACVDINPGSALSCPDDHLIYYRFTGRVLGRALFDRQLVKGHMVRMIYKHLLGWPLTIEDIKAQDEEYYHSLKKLMKMEDVSLMCLDFTANEEYMGMRTEQELVEDGSNKVLNNDNLLEYLEANIKYRIFNRVSLQLTELLLGFFDVVPEPALTVFDANELELMLCGLPEINLEDWKAHTRYKGLFEFVGENHKVVQWFWEVVENDFDQEMRARLLQFSTGTSGVPARGFNYLQGIDGNIKKFTIQGVDHNAYMFPKSHTCFNRIDLPDFTSKEELKERLTIAITTSFVGFDTE